jgi:Spy/CpxP family protein refolding chaperone
VAVCWRAADGYSFFHFFVPLVFFVVFPSHFFAPPLRLSAVAVPHNPLSSRHKIKTTMTTIKLFAAALLIGVASFANAQSTEAETAKACADMTKAKVELLTKELNLDKDQTAKANDLLAKNEESLMGMRGHCETMDAKAKEQDKATYASIAEMLNPEQQKKMQELQASGKLESCGKEGGKGCCAGKKGSAKAEAEKK